MWRFNLLFFKFQFKLYISATDCQEAGCFMVRLLNVNWLSKLGFQLLFKVRRIWFTVTLNLYIEKEVEQLICSMLVYCLFETCKFSIFCIYCELSIGFCLFRWRMNFRYNRPWRRLIDSVIVAILKCICKRYVKFAYFHIVINCVKIKLLMLYSSLFCATISNCNIPWKCIHGEWWFSSNMRL